jgi:hypothetical protein
MQESDAAGQIYLVVHVVPSTAHMYFFSSIQIWSELLFESLFERQDTQLTCMVRTEYTLLGWLGMHITKFAPLQLPERCPRPHDRSRLTLRVHRSFLGASHYIFDTGSPSRTTAYLQLPYLHFYTAQQHGLLIFSFTHLPRGLTQLLIMNKR